MSRSREIIKVENAHVLNDGAARVRTDGSVIYGGTPCVVIDRQPGEATVYIANAPSGIGSHLLTVLNPRPGGKAERHARYLSERLEYAALRELERLARIKANGGAK